MPEEHRTLGFRNTPPKHNKKGKRKPHKPSINSQHKGINGEREIVRMLRTRGIDVKRIPMSGALWWMKGDLQFSDKIKGEVKRRKRINKLFYEILTNAQFGFVRGDNEDWLVFMNLDEFVEMYRAWKKIK